MNLRKPCPLLLALLLIASVAACTVPAPDTSQEAGVPEFEGVIARSYEESEEWWPSTYSTPPAEAPNVVILLLDDTGFAQFGSYGALIDTPNLDRLADNGLRFNNFHTVALCSPSRATIMAGRNPHSIGLGSHSLTAMGFPGYNAIVPEDAKSVAKTLQLNGYVNYALGKWDHTPLYEVSQAGPFHRWPSGEGFDHYYGFMAADADMYRTVMYDGHTPVENWKEKDDYHNTTDITDRAIENISGHVSTARDRNFMVFWAPGAMHSPHQAPQEYLDKYRGRFDMGWDEAREQILARQLELGIVPPNTRLSPRIDEIAAWDSLTDDEKALYARQMEVFAAQMEHTDNEIGRIIDTLERVGELDNTIIFVTSDNGASGEGGLAGTFNETYVLNGLQTPLDANLRHIDDWGGPSTYPHYHAGWAMAGNTPFKYFKQSVHRGGQADALIVHWPDGIQARGEIRGQYHHIADIAPTILDVTGIEMPAVIEGIRQRPMDGVSMRYAFDNADAPTVKTVQYYEMFGNRAIWADGWKAVTLHANRMPWELNAVLPFENDEWELYNVDEDFSESVDVADEFPERLAELQELFDEEAWKYNVYPLYDDMISRISKQQDRLFAGQTEFTFYYPGAQRIAEKASPPVKGRSHTIETSIDLTGNEEGVIVAVGGFTGGYTMFIKDGRLFYEYNFLDGAFYTLQSEPLPTGETTLGFRFDHAGNFAGTGHLFVNGEEVDTVEMPRTHNATFSLSEPFDVGRDNGTQVSLLYQGSFPFTGALDRVVFRLID